ncbi:MAG: flagellar biosynthetic protein FliO [Phycisphaerae bacterium]|nr:flagellar biosynthetic protein FliO [Phycisphaerae bacterium]
MNKILTLPQVKRTLWLMGALLACVICLTIASPGRGQSPPTGLPPTPPAERGEGVSPSRDVPPAPGDEEGSAPSDDPAHGTHNAGETPASREGGTPPASPLPTRGEGGLPTKPNPSTPFGWELLTSVLVVLVLGGVAFVVIKRVLPRWKLGSLVGGGRQVRLRESVSLGLRQQVHLLEVGGRRLLVSSTRENIRLLADVTDAFDEGQGVGAEAGAVSGPAAGAVSDPGQQRGQGGFAGLFEKKLGGDA